MLNGKKIIGTVAYLGGVFAVPEKFCWSFAQMVQYNSEYLCEVGETIYYTRATASYHAYARNTICEQMRGDWVLMLDIDHTFDPDLCARMIYQMNRHEIDVLTAIYQYKMEPHNPLIYGWNEDNTLLTMIGDWDTDSRLFEVGSAGAGSLMIRKSVVKQIKDNGKNPFDIIPPFSEDHSFFKRLKDYGIKAYCDPHIESNHLLVKPLTLTDYKKSELTFSERREVEGRV